MYRKQLQPKPLAVAVMAALISLTALPALAQDAAQDKKEEAKTLDALVVTAQKREEAMQDVPIVVTSLSQQILQDTGVRDIKDLQILVPGLTVTSTQNEAITTARIRGIGTVGDNVGLESSVGVVIDGVYRPRNSVGFGDLGELERIEVLKGPQGTLFGKNTSAGVINVVTRNPDFELGGAGEVTFGNYGALGLAGWFNAPLGDYAAFRIYAAHRDRDGWMDVVSGAGPRTEDKDYDQNFRTFRGKLLLAPTDNVEIVLSADSTKRDENCCTAVQLVSGSTAAIINGVGGGNAIAVPANPWARVAYSNRDTTQKMNDRGLQAEVNVDLDALGGATFTSVTGNRDWDAVNGRDFDFTAADLIYQSPEANESFARFKTFSQEFRLAGSTDKVDWLLGFFYANEDLERNESYRVGAGYEPYLSTLVGANALPGLAASLNPILANYGLSFNTSNPALFLSQFTGKAFGTNFTGLGALDKYRQNAKTTALFTNNTWHATEAFDVTLGLRYTREKKELESLYSNPNGSLGCGTALANPGAAVSRLLAARINGFSQLSPQLQQQLLAGLVPAVAGNQALMSGIIGRACLPWSNALHNGRATDQSRSENEWSGTLKMAYRWNESAMTYFSAARGYKAGGFNLDRVQSSNGLSSGAAGIVPVDDTSFPGEFVDSYELGAKTTWAGGNLLLNGALFHQTYSDFQLNSFLGTSFVVRSIPKVTSQGIDAELLWQATPGLMLQTGLVYADTKYGKTIPGADFAAPAGQLYKLPGAQMSFAPKWSLSASMTYEWDIGANMEGRFNIGTKYQSEYNTGSDLDAEKLQDAYAVVNARIGIGARDRKWQVELWGTNILDKDYVQVGFDGPLQAVGSPAPNDPANTYNAFLGAPAMYGMTLRFQF
ncbi:MAG TPA: TonB-dependent receptor [Thermomonas sp.]|jgi:outer membrane receptor protein involved in Fe transport|nr:TonB-dependent receptor [Thermomonas sp.]HPM56687.1 TonB-dependent receptor [Thermomonas sp.]HPW13302.1 TonB-dependent receptor [Thermomonas sp.]